MREEKKELCKALTGVLRRSPLGEQIDPKAFYVMLHTNFNQFYPGGECDLQRLWDALCGDDPSSAPLFGLFLAFEAELTERGFAVKQAAAVRALSTRQASSYRALAADSAGASRRSGGTVVGPAPGSRPPPRASSRTSQGPVRAKLAVSRRSASEGPNPLRRDIVEVVVESMMSPKVEAGLSKTKFAYLVDSQLMQLFDGKTLDPGAIVSMLREVDGLSDEDIYVGLIELERQLSERNIVLAPVSLSIDSARAQKLRGESVARRRGASPSPADLEHLVDPSSEREDERSSSALSGWLTGQSGESRRERLMRGKGLATLSPKVVKALRYGFLTIAFSGVLLLGWLFRPDRTVDVGLFASTGFPIVKAEVRDGMFFGTVDERRWWPVPVDERAKKIEGFRGVLHAKGWVTNAQVRDLAGRLVLSGVGGGKLAVAPVFKVGDATGTIPAERSHLMKSTPAEARGMGQKKDKKAR